MNKLDKLLEGAVTWSNALNVTKGIPYDRAIEILLSDTASKINLFKAENAVLGEKKATGSEAKMLIGGALCILHGILTDVGDANERFINATNTMSHAVYAMFRDDDAEALDVLEEVMTSAYVKRQGFDRFAVAHIASMQENRGDNHLFFIALCLTYGWGVEEDFAKARSYADLLIPDENSAEAIQQLKNIINIVEEQSQEA